MALQLSQSKGKERLLITAVALGIMLNPLNTTMISVALNRIQDDFQLTFADLSWIISTYYLASAIAQPIMGKWSDLFGRKRVFMAGLLLVTAASCLAPLSPTYGWLLGFRIIQAVGSAALYPAGMGMIRNQITSNQARALGVLSIFSGISAAFGPSIGGFLLHYGDWPMVFLINFPFILASFILTWKVFPQDSIRNGSPSHMDWAGVLFFSITVFMWLLTCMSFEDDIILLKLAVSILLSSLFYRFELGKSSPFIDVAFLRKNMNVTMIYLQFILMNLIFYSLMFGMPSYLQRVQQLDAQMTGLVMLSIAGFSVMITPIAGRWIDRSGSKPALLLGTSGVIVAMLLILLIQADTHAVTVFLLLSVMGISYGFNNLGMQTALYEFVSKEETGVASGLFMTSRYMGTILSSSLLAALFGQQITTAHLHSMAWVCAVIGILILLLTIRLPARVLEERKS